MNNDFVNKIIKYLMILLGSIFIIFIILSFFRLGIVYWFFDKSFEWVSMRLGFDYYLALFVSVVSTILFSMSFPYLAWTFLLGRKFYVASLIMVGVTGLMCVLIYTVGKNVYFDRISGEPLKWYADTPTGRFESNAPGFDPKYGIRLNRYTKEMAIKEANDKILKENEERKRKEKEAQARILREKREQLRKEKEEKERIEREAKEKEAKEKELAEVESSQSRDINEIKSPVEEREYNGTVYIDSLKANVTSLRFFEGGIDMPAQYNRTYRNAFVNDETKYIYWELNLRHPMRFRRDNFIINAVWHFPDNRIRYQKAHTYINSNWSQSRHAIRWGAQSTDKLIPGRYIVDLYVQNDKIASGSFVVYR
jgi:hypothetical protein